MKIGDVDMDTTDWLDLVEALSEDVGCALGDFAEHIGSSTHPDKKRLRGHARHLRTEARLLAAQIKELRTIVEEG